MDNNKITFVYNMDIEGPDTCQNDKNWFVINNNLIQESVDRRLGLFSQQVNEVNPLAAYEGCKLEPCVPQVGPHDIWIKVS